MIWVGQAALSLNIKFVLDVHVSLQPFLPSAVNICRLFFFVAAKNLRDHDPGLHYCIDGIENVLSHANAGSLR